MEKLFTKICTKCKEEKLISDFYKRNHPVTKLLSECKKCSDERRNRWLLNNKGRARELSLANGWRRRGIDVKEAQKILETQNSCQLCGETENLCLDHDHKTGKIRGVLCRKHNLGLGYFDDDPTLLSKTIEYLGKTVYN